MLIRKMTEFIRATDNGYQRINEMLLWNAVESREANESEVQSITPVEPLRMFIGRDVVQVVQRDPQTGRNSDPYPQEITFPIEVQTLAEAYDSFDIAKTKFIEFIKEQQAKMAANNLVIPTKDQAEAINNAGPRLVRP